MANVRFRKEDWGGDQARADAAQAIADEAWNNTNPAGTPVDAWTKPTFNAEAFSAESDLGKYPNKYGAWADFTHRYGQAYARDNPADRGLAGETAAAVANGTLSGKDIASNYGAMAAKYMDMADSMGDFSYDFNTDPLFQTLAQSYMAQARNAANDASALAATRTGGYGNSYGAVAAGQQYNDALRSLYDNIPELEEAAYNRWQNKKNDYYAKAGYYRDMENTAYDRYVTEEERDYDRQQTEEEKEYTRKYNAAVAAAELGEYGPLEDLLGVNLDIARSNDQLNKVLSIIQGFGGDIPSAGALIQQILAQGLGTRKATGETGADGATGATNENGTQQAADTEQQYNPAESAGKMVVGGEEVWLPPSQTLTGTYEYFIKPENGNLMYTYTDSYGNKHTEPYSGVLITTGGRTINYNPGMTLMYTPSYPLSMTGGVQQQAAADGTAQQSAYITTGDPITDFALQLNGVIDPTVAQSLEKATEYEFPSDRDYYVYDENGAFIGTRGLGRHADFGYGNTGYGNTGYGNTGYGNTDYGNNTYGGGYDYGNSGGGNGNGSDSTNSGGDVKYYPMSEDEWKRLIGSLG